MIRAMPADGSKKGGIDGKADAAVPLSLHIFVLVSGELGRSSMAMPTSHRHSLMTEKRKSRRFDGGSSLSIESKIEEEEGTVIPIATSPFFLYGS